MDIPKKIINKKLYSDVKKDIYKKYPTHSAYRSGLIMKEYEKRGGKIKKTTNEKPGLSIWFKEKWLNLTPYAEGLVKTISDSPPCGKRHPNQKGPSVCRPSIKINNETPNLAKSYNKKQIQNAVSIKKQGKRINWDKL